ncbi:hypothetical protein K2Y11_20535, partial [bacterium]|nr:hypothetical protein [bacterium]
GILIDAVKDPKARHTTEYCTEAQKRAYDWLAPRMLPPTEPETTESTSFPEATPTEVETSTEESKPPEAVPVEPSAQ